MATTECTPQTLWSIQALRIPTRVFENSDEAVRHAADLIDQLVRERRSAGLPCVLGLPTGSTPVGVYRELVRRHRQEDLDFSHVVTFNLDEYYPIQPTDAQSYHRFMREQFFDHVNIPVKNIHIPDGAVPFERVDIACDRYEDAIYEAGGIDLLLVGIGRTGHVGFNEPGSSRTSKTRMVRLDPLTRHDAAASFYGEENVPMQAVTMGLGTVLECKKIVLLAFGEHKAEVVRKALEQAPSDHCPASILQEHRDTVFILDRPAASLLTMIRMPWMVGRVDWTPTLIRKAVLWLGEQAKKALLKLTHEDFHRFDLDELLREYGPAATVCRRVFDEMQQTICDEPAGSKPETVLCFSPHPDDDVISMGGTLRRLKQQGATVHIAYMTSGNVAVHDHDAARFANFVADFNNLFQLDCDRTLEIEKKIHDFLKAKTTGQVDCDEVLALKALVRKTEATAGAAVIGIGEELLHFLDLPFYRTGRAAKNPPGEADVSRVYDLLKALKPAQIYVAGDLADPHGTHRLCALVCFQAVERYRA
ncbi:MAG: glucosamine-6-phosphate deaminase, partial [Planctomycetia bacterium]